MKITEYVILFIVVFSCSCQRYESFGFTSKEMTYPWGNILVKLQGTIDDSRVFFAERGAPYDLYILFYFNEKINKKKVKILMVTLQDKKTEKILFRKENIEIINDNNRQKDKIYFVVRKLNLEHKDMTMELNFTIYNNADIIESSVRLEVEKDNIVKYQLIGV